MVCLGGALSHRSQSQSDIKSIKRVQLFKVEDYAAIANCTALCCGWPHHAPSCVHQHASSPALRARGGGGRGEERAQTCPPRSTSAVSISGVARGDSRDGKFPPLLTQATYGGGDGVAFLAAGLPSGERVLRCVGPEERNTPAERDNIFIIVNVITPSHCHKKKNWRANTWSLPAIRLSD